MSNIPTILGEYCQLRPGKTSLLNPRFVAEMMGFPTDWTELPSRNGENIELFKALAAMNDDNDREQWFINDNYADVGCVMWHLCEEKKFKHYYVEWEDGETDICSDFRKATAEEIIEHFKSKQP